MLLNISATLTVPRDYGGKPVELTVYDLSGKLDAVILDVCDEELVNSILTAELIMNKSLYADSYVEAFRK